MGKPAPKGNKYATKLKDPDHRQEAYKQYCAHIAKGLDKKSWKFVHPVDLKKCLCYETMERYARENPTEFEPILMQMAKADSFAWYEQEGFKLMQGKYRNGSPETWKTFMRNKFDWDKEQLDVGAKCAADVMLEKLMEFAPEKKKHYEKKK